MDNPSLALQSPYVARLRRRLEHRADTSDGWALAEAILDSPLLRTVPASLARRFDGVDRTDAEDVFADALYELVRRVDAGERIREPVRYLRRSCTHMCLELAKRRRTSDDAYDDERHSPDDAGADGTEPSRDVLRREALRVARSVLPTITAVRQREALAVLLDGVADEVEVSNDRLAATLGVAPEYARVLRNRAFKRLEEAVRREGVQLNIQWAFDVEDAEADELDLQEDEDA